MLLDRLHLGIDNRTSIEGADRQRDVEWLRQKPHPDDRAARDDGEGDASVVQPLHRPSRAIGKCFVLCQKRAVDIGHNKRDPAHARCLRGLSLPAGPSLSWRMMSSTIASTEASIDTVTGFSLVSGR